MIAIETEQFDQEMPEDGSVTVEQYRKLEEQYQDLSRRYDSLLREYEELKQSKSRAGRKPNDEKWTAKYKAFATLKDKGLKRQQIQEELNMSRATYFRYQKIYSGQETVSSDFDTVLQHTEPIQKTVPMHLEPAQKEIPQQPETDSKEKPQDSLPIQAITSSAKDSIDNTNTAAAKDEGTVSSAPSDHPNEGRDGLVQDPETGEYVTPEGLKRRRKLAEIRARLAAEKEMKRRQAELEAAEQQKDEMQDEADKSEKAAD